MKLDEIRQLSGRLAELFGKYGIAEPAVFGSVARGDAGPDSDVDLGLSGHGQRSLILNIRP